MGMKHALAIGALLFVVARARPAHAQQVDVAAADAVTRGGEGTGPSLPEVAPAFAGPLDAEGGNDAPQDEAPRLVPSMRAERSAAPAPLVVDGAAGAPAAETPGMLDPQPVGPGTTAWSVALGASLITEYRLAFPAGGEWFHEFDLTRGWAWIDLRVGDVAGRVLFETTRAGGEGALVGVGGDSLVVRAREAWVGERLFQRLDLRVGLIPTLTVNALSEPWAMRALAPVGLRQFGPLEAVPPADLGASARLELPEGFGALAAMYSNGDGYRARELNRGKTVELLAQIHPFAWVPEVRPLVVTLGYQNGSVGTGSARADRLVGAVAWADPRLGLGVEGSLVLGLEDRGDREALLVEAWARAEPFDEVPLLIAARYGHLSLDTQAGAPGSSASTFTGAVGARVAPPLRAFVAFDARLPEGTLDSAWTGFERWNVRIVVEGQLAGRLSGSF